MDGKTALKSTFDKIEARLNEVPINCAYLEGLLAGVQILRAMEFCEGYHRDRAIDLYQLYGQVLQLSRFSQSPEY